MCFHSKQSKQAQEVKKRFNAEIVDEQQFAPSEHYNGFVFPRTPVIRDVHPHIIEHVNWGLVPSWAEDKGIRQYTLNAKIETLHEKPSFRQVTEQRCLVIADGFYEWQWLDAKGRNKEKYTISLPDESLFAFGGLWSEWENQKTGDLLTTYTIVTTQANELMAEIHNSKKRMPVVLTAENEERWLRGQEFNAFENVEIELLARPENPLLF